MGGGGFVLGLVLRLVVGWPWYGVGWGGVFAGGFALVLVALLGALVAVAGLLAAVDLSAASSEGSSGRGSSDVLCAVGRSRTQ